MTYGEMLVRSVTEWIADNQVAMQNAAHLLTWLVAWIVGSLLAAIIIGPRRGWRMLMRLEKACERWMGR